MPNLSPDPEPHVQAQERICSFCDAYCFRSRLPGDPEYGQAYCREKGDWFDDQQNGVPAGLRGCPKWR